MDAAKLSQTSRFMSLVPTTEIISPLLKKTTTIFRQERNKFKNDRFTFLTSRGHYKVWPQWVYW